MAIYGGQRAKNTGELKSKIYDYGRPYSDMSRLPDSMLQKIKKNKFFGLKKYKAKSLYKCAETYGEERKNLPYDYTKTLLSKMLSPYIYRKRDVSGFLDFINDWIVTLLQGVGKLKILKNFTVDKDYKHIK